MDIGIGLPATIPGVDRATLLDWARRAGFTQPEVLDIVHQETLDAFAKAASRNGA